MLILGIETSCDETSVAFLEVRVPRQARDKTRNFQFRVLSNVVSSQVKLHAKFGGVVPSLAARKHSENIDKVFNLALKESEISKKPDLIAVTKGPGLAPSLLVGVNFAKFLSWSSGIPLVGVNHLEGHIFSNWLRPIGANSKSETLNTKQKIRFPAVVLIVSGGHTELVLMKNYGKYVLLGQTLDDAAGECFDKVARLLNLGYPGGPIIDKLAKQGDPEAFDFPSPLIHSKDYNFSFSGLKTAVLYFLRDNGINFSAEGRPPASGQGSAAGGDFSRTKLSSKQEQLKKDICASFEGAAIRVLVKKTLRAAQEFKAKSILVGGGVAANSFLKESFLKNSDAIFPERNYITDNAAMIACAGFFSAFGGSCQFKKPSKDSWKEVFTEPNLPLVLY